MSQAGSSQDPVKTKSPLLETDLEEEGRRAEEERKAMEAVDKQIAELLAAREAARQKAEEEKAKKVE